MTSLEERIIGLAKLGEYLKDLETEEINSMCEKAFFENRWFTIENVKEALCGIRDSFLDESKTKDWISSYNIPTTQRKVGLVLAGNIPAVGWNDIQCTFLANQIAMIKYAEKDKVIIPFLIEKLISFNPDFESYFEVVERLNGFDAVIATGSDNTARYFESYFGKYQNIIRKNRHAIGILDGNENAEDLMNLGKDIFTYFGLGCRNVSKIYVPGNYNFHMLLETLHDYKEIVHHNKYKNNFDYNIALFLLNRINYQNNGCLILLEDKRLTSRISSLHYEYYSNPEDLETKLQEVKDSLQCIVGKQEFSFAKTFPFGEAQCPSLYDFADGVDTMKFLTTLN